MRTNIDIDDELMEKTLKETGETTKKGAVNAALRAFIRMRSQAGIQKLRGKIQWEGDLNESRQGRISD